MNDIQEMAILGSTLQAYHTAILLKNQGFQVRVYEQESDHLNQVWLPLRIGAMSQENRNCMMSWLNAHMTPTII